MQQRLREAERRIEEARATQAESLDLGDLALDELPAGLKGLPHLRRLYLGRSSPSETGLEWDFNRESPRFKDLALLAGLERLQTLSLSDCENVTDLTPLAGLQGLQSLNLSGTSVADLTPLAGLQGLQSLDLLDAPLGS